MSSLSAANDSLEGRVVGQVFTRMLSTMGLSRGVVDVASIIVEGYANSTEGFAFCLSERGDLLSQWRAYARDGTGLSIGFDSDVLVSDFGNVNFGSKFYELIQVSYGEEELEGLIFPILDNIKREVSDQGEFIRLRDGLSKESALKALADREGETEGIFVGLNRNSSELLSRLLKLLSPLHFEIYSTKPKSFEEESEWRLVRYRHRVPLSDVEYSADDFSIRPYISCLMANPAKVAVRELILGPKHRSDINWIRAFLASIDLSHVRVTRSSISSYR